MWTKPYGSTGKDVSVIGFGGMRFKDPKDIDASAAVLQYAHSRGINYFDTAPYYCDDKSEIIFGKALKSLKRDSYFISTKCGDATAAAMDKSLNRSLERLGTGYIDFFHIWCLVNPQQLPERIEKGAVGAAVKAKEKGLIKHLVVSTHLNGEQIGDVLDTGYFEGMTIGYNVLNFPFRAKGLEAAARKNLGVVTMNPLGGGLIPQNAGRLAFIKGPHDKDVVQAAIRFNISQPAITSALVGVSSEAEVDHAVAAVEDFKPYDAAHIERLKKHITASFDGFCTGCGYCLPCPSDVEIPKLMDAFNHQILSGGKKGEQKDAIKNRLKWHWGIAPDAAAKCLQCGDCESACTQHHPIRQRLEAIAALAGKYAGRPRPSDHSCLSQRLPVASGRGQAFDVTASKAG